MGRSAGRVSARTRRVGEVRGTDISGAVVNLAARVHEEAPESVVYVTSTVRDMLLGSAWSFIPAGSRQLKGFDDDCTLFEAVS